MCGVAEKLLAVEALLEKTELSEEWYSELKEVLSGIKSTGIPTTGTLRYICQNACPSAYENIEFPQRRYENNVTVEEVSEDAGISSGNEGSSTVDPDASISNISSLKSIDNQYYEELERNSNPTGLLLDPDLVPTVHEKATSGSLPCTADESKKREMYSSSQCSSSFEDVSRPHSEQAIPRPRSKSVEFCGSKRNEHQNGDTVFKKTEVLEVVETKSSSEDPVLDKPKQNHPCKGKSFRFLK